MKSETETKIKRRRMKENDLFRAEKLAIKYCEQYGYERGSEEWIIASGAFCVAYRMKKENDDAAED